MEARKGIPLWCIAGPQEMQIWAALNEVQGPEEESRGSPHHLHPSSPVGLVADPKLLSFKTE